MVGEQVLGLIKRERARQEVLRRERGWPDHQSDATYQMVVLEEVLEWVTAMLQGKSLDEQINEAMQAAASLAAWAEERIHERSNPPRGPREAKR